MVVTIPYQSSAKRARRPERSAAEIELSVSKSRQTVRVEVADAGRGFTVRSRVSGQDEGSGWGLHLSRC